MEEDWQDAIESEALSDTISKPYKPIKFPRVQELKDLRGNKCKVCESSGSARNPLEFAHVKPTELTGKGRGQTQRYYDIRNNPKCYELLCKGCHRKFERGAIKL